MAGWDEVLREFGEAESPSDQIRRKYLDQLFKLTDRNVIAYYSAFLSNPRCENIDINDLDMTGFMNSIKGLDCSKGLDLILHTPGGSPVAAEAIVNYLRKKFCNNIRVIVPQLAMSAGTMMACSANEIVMGSHSSLGPIYPQINGIPAYNMKLEFEEAKQDLSINPKNANYWAIQLNKYPAAFLKTALDSIDLSGELLEKWLGTCMFNGEKDQATIKNITDTLNEHDTSKSHGRHFNVDFCKNIGLKIKCLEEDPELQNAVLSLHHAYMISLGPNSIKIIENHKGKAFIMNKNQ